MAASSRAVVRGYTVALSMLGFTGVWAAVAHQPRPQGPTAASATATSPALRARIAAQDTREARLRIRAAQVARIVAARTARAAEPPLVRIVQVPPVTQTRSS